MSQDIPAKLAMLAAELRSVSKIGSSGSLRDMISEAQGAWVRKFWDLLVEDLTRDGQILTGSMSNSLSPYPLPYVRGELDGQLMTLVMSSPGLQFFGFVSWQVGKQHGSEYVMLGTPQQAVSDLKRTWKSKGILP